MNEPRHGSGFPDASSELTEEQRETIGDCDECMAATCTVCGHSPCPVCVDDCDHHDCIEWKGNSGTKKHVCVFARCADHADKKGSSRS